MKFGGWSFHSLNVFKINKTSKEDAGNGETAQYRSCRSFDKFLLLMWKNWLLQYRHKTQTIIQILMPILFTANLVYVRSLVKPEINVNKTIYKEFGIDTIPVRQFMEFRPPSSYGNVQEWKLIYSPKNVIFESLLNEAAVSLGLDGVEGVNSTEELETIMIDREIFAGVLFEHAPNVIELPKKLSYTLRFPSEMRRVGGGVNPFFYNWQTNLLFPLISGGGPQGGPDDEGGSPYYFAEGFLGVQNAIARAFLRSKCNETNCGDPTLPDIKMHRFPFPPYIFDVMLDGIEKVAPLFVMLSFVYPIISTVRFIAVEKEKQLKEVMKIMGMPVWLHWVSWFVRTMIFMIISISFVVILLKIPMFETSTSVFTNSSWMVLWVFFFIYSISMTMYCFILSVFFSKSNTAAAVAGLMWFISYMPFVVLTLNNIEVPFLKHTIACISPNVAMAYGCKSIVGLERNGEGLQWTNIFGPTESHVDLSVGETLYCMIISSILYLLITLYIERVYPGEYGVPEKWYFPFTMNFWLDRKNPCILNDDLQCNGIEPENFESEPKDCVTGVQVKNIRKVYDNGRIACKGLSFKMFRDQITVLLGHNGAGKSTIIKMLIGLIPPTSGTAIVNGYDIQKDLLNARKSLGICPQHDILFNELTVREHIEFYSRLKGLHANAIQKEVNKYVRLLNLESKIDSMSKTLSGGMKRKLSFGIALCGGSTVVLCDEPTSGMDPTARRELWDLIQSEKIGRTIILTTHFMDEADVLGDRIAIMADGELKCCGTSFFLKKQFGSGYKLICVKKDGCDSSAVTKLLREYVPAIDISEEFDGNLSYTLPHEHSAKFGKMFEILENKLDTLKLHRFGVSSTELEEVFLKVGSDNKSLQNPLSEKSESDVIINSDKESLKFETLHGLQLLANQWRAMFKKRYYSWLNSWFLLVAQNVTIIFFVVMTVAVVRMAKDFSNLPKIELTMDTYGANNVLFKMQPTNDSAIESIMKQYRKDVLNERDAMLNEVSADVEDQFLLFGKDILIRTNTRHLVGLSNSENGSLIAWFNSQLFHVAPLSLNMVHNAILRSKLGSKYGIHVSNWPIPFNPESKALLTINGSDMGSEMAKNLSFAMAFIVAFYVMFYIRERTSKAKLLQFISGVGAFTFWATSFLFDFATIGLSIFVLLVTLALFGEEHWATIEELTPLFVILVMFALATLAIVFVTSFLYSHASYGFVSLVVFFIFTGISMYMLIRVLSLPAFEISDEVYDSLKWVVLAFPHYALASGLFSMHQFRLAKEVCTLKCDRVTKLLYNMEYTMEVSIPRPEYDGHINKIIGLPMYVNAIRDIVYKNDTVGLLIQWNEPTHPTCDPNVICDMNPYAWKEPGIGRNLTYMLATTIVFLIILWIIESRICSRIHYFVFGFIKPKLPPVISSDTTNVDVLREKNSVHVMTPNDLQANNLVLRNLTKFYGDFMAVRGISVSVKSSECFGLLGSNGAGKTSAFKMMTGDISISGGDVFVNGRSVKSNLTEVRKMIGYCPQFDALLEDLTGSQTLEIFGLLRGYRQNDIPAMSARLTNSMNLTKHIDKETKTYSGGNKRKLSTAIALMGNLDVIYLDEPSSGMDPGAKRNLWNVVTQVRNSGSSIVLTSHSMEECEAICTRLAIMVRGEFKCLGSAQHLKNQFSKGFILTMKVLPRSSLITTHSSPDHAQIQINRFIHTYFPGAYLKEKIQGLLTFYIPQTTELKWSSMFSHIENAKGILGIEDYSITQTTLEQVFLSFTKSYDIDSSKSDISSK